MSSPAPAPARIDVRPGSLEAWRIAVRTRTLWIATVPVFVGTSFAYLASGEVDVLFASLALVASVLLQAIANLQNDVGYTARGAETGTRIGLPRATSTGLLTPREVRILQLRFGLVDGYSYTLEEVGKKFGAGRRRSLYHNLRNERLIIGRYESFYILFQIFSTSTWSCTRYRICRFNNDSLQRFLFSFVVV